VKTRTKALRFVEALGRYEGVDAIELSESEVIVRVNGGGIKIAPLDRLSTYTEVHPDEVVSSAEVHPSLMVAFRAACGRTFLGFDGPTPKGLKPVVKGMFCFTTPDGRRGIAFDGSNGTPRDAVQVTLWRPEQHKHYVPNGLADAFEAVDYRFGDHIQ